MSNEKTNEYEGETCEGCVHFESTEEENYCWSPARFKSRLPGFTACGDFVPSIDCRRTRAAERQATAMERLAEDFHNCLISTDKDLFMTGG
jgi:hypothetical protein